MSGVNLEALMKRAYGLVKEEKQDSNTAVFFPRWGKPECKAHKFAGEVCLG